MFQRVLIAVDGSECATRAAQAGIDVAATYGARVDVVAAVHRELDEAQAETVLADVESLAADADVDVETHVATGHPATVVVSLADDIDADVVVMGRHGHGGVRERILGSVTDRVLRSTQRHVLTVPVGSSRIGDYENVLLPTDGSEAAAAAAAPAVDVAEQYGATLHLLTVVDVRREAGPFSAGGVDQAYVERLLDRAREDVDELAERCEDIASEDLDVERTAAKGTPSKGIAEYVEENDVDFVAIASTGESSLTGQLLGSTTDRVLRIIDEPVLVVHPQD
ncbi:universal stress protein [Haloarchaeobius sp. HRN-SO-5]|uniref:universal stress protein n=1 Tax=Haloarchaeobius sp. HRN-SO-5 TaxID=3446118 RepID=UPI003EBC9268